MHGMLSSANYNDTDNVTKVAADLMDSIHNVRGRALRTARDMANNIANAAVASAAAYVACGMAGEELLDAAERDENANNSIDR
jgi:hypothetical protein